MSFRALYKGERYPVWKMEWEMNPISNKLEPSNVVVCRDVEDNPALEIWDITLEEGTDRRDSDGVYLFEGDEVLFCGGEQYQGCWEFELTGVILKEDGVFYVVNSRGELEPFNELFNYSGKVHFLRMVGVE